LTKIVYLRTSSYASRLALASRCASLFCIISGSSYF